jgi:exodeoxyribonuclease-3
MNIATFNINGVSARLPLLLDWLASRAPDVVCLQELKVAQNRFPAGALEKAGYGSVWSAEGAYNGVAVLSRGAAPIMTRRALPGDPTDSQCRYIEVAAHGVLVASLYAPNGNPQPGPRFDYKLAWMARLEAHARELVASGVPVVLAGDYNVVPTPADMYASKSSWKNDALVQPPSREAFRRLLDLGFLDALRAAHPSGGESLHTFWDYKRFGWERGHGLRIDHLLVGPALRGRFITAGVDREERGRPGASDHTPAWLTLA